MTIELYFKSDGTVEKKHITVVEKPSISRLQTKYAGIPGAILGGGPSLHDDYRLLAGEVLTLAVNHHSLIAGYPADYCVFLDNPSDAHNCGRLRKALKTFDGVRVSRAVKWTHYKVDIPVYWKASYSSMFATWLALYMGCDPVILCGMDLYQGDEPYCHPVNDKERMNAAGNQLKSVHNQKNSWKSAFKKCPHPERIRAASGPLVDVFPKYEG